MNVPLKLYFLTNILYNSNLTYHSNFPHTHYFLVYFHIQSRLTEKGLVDIAPS